MKLCVSLVCEKETRRRYTVMVSLCLFCHGSETHTAAGEAEHSLQRNDQMSDNAPQRGTGMVSYASVVVFPTSTTLSHPLDPDHSH